MENRKPFRLQNTLILYNAIQVIFSAWIFYEVILVLTLLTLKKGFINLFQKFNKIFLLKKNVYSKVGEIY